MQEPETAEELMRSRFAAFRDGDPAWLLESWHPDTRPETIDLDPEVTWLRLQIVDTVAGGPAEDTGIVEFRAIFRDRGKREVLHERSRFTRVDGCWRYLDGVVGSD